MFRTLLYYCSLLMFIGFAGCSAAGTTGANAPVAANGNSSTQSVAMAATSTATASASPKPSAAASPSASPTHTATPNPTPTATAKASSTATATAKPTATATAIPTMVATSADAFVSSMGVDVDLTTATASAQPMIDKAFAGLGVRHTRIAILEPDSTYEGYVKSLFAAAPSAKAYGTTNCSPPLGPYASADITAADVTGFQSRTGNHIDIVEGMNEPDQSSDKNWPADTHSCFSPLVGNVGGLPLAVPALSTVYQGTDQKALGVVSGAKYGNIHRYFSGRNPDTTGWGGNDACGTYGGTAWQICWAKVTAPGEPLVVTETGWNTDNEVDELTQAKYVERVFFVNAQAGIAATSLYTLVSYAGGDGFGGDGLVNTDFSVKPSYTAIANMTKLLSDAGSAYTPSPLQIGISPAPVSALVEGLHAMLLGKRDGSYDLAIWQEVQSANPNEQGDDTIPATVNVKLTLASSRTATLYAWQDSGSAPTTALGSGLSFTVPVTDRLSIVQLK